MDLADTEAIYKKADKMVDAKVKEIVTKLKATHEKWTDPDFGPNASDEYGTKSLYPETPDPAGSAYTEPKALEWMRPLYADSKFNEAGEQQTLKKVKVRN